jgi:hypothetical protein
VGHVVAVYEHRSPRDLLKPGAEVQKGLLGLERLQSGGGSLRVVSSSVGRGGRLGMGSCKRGLLPQVVAMVEIFDEPGMAVGGEEADPVGRPSSAEGG